MCLAKKKTVQMWEEGVGRGRGGEGNTLHTVQKLENANKCNLAIFISFLMLFFSLL